MYLVTVISVAVIAYFECVILIVPHILFVPSHYITIFIVLCIKTLKGHWGCSSGPWGSSREVQAEPNKANI